MFTKFKKAYSNYKSMGKIKKFFLTSILSFVAIVSIFFGAIIISAIVDIANDTSVNVESSEVIPTTIFEETSSFIKQTTTEPTTTKPTTTKPTTTKPTTTKPTTTKPTTTKPTTTKPTTTKPTTTKPATTKPTATTFKIDLNKIPSFSNKPYITLNNNQPTFFATDKKTTSFEKYSPLDNKGRCGVAYACLGKDIMPTGERGKIGSVKPSGWHTVKYAGIDGNYLYNRCHLIGWQLSGENANERNLITGTRYMNVEGMLPFENMVADYIKETNNHVLYRVTPVFKGDNLLASGVQIEAFSVEDNGNGICLNVYCYNAQPGISINYSDGSSSGPAMAESTTRKPTTTKKETTVSKPATTKNETSTRSNSSSATYILNINPSSMKFHFPSCSSVGNMNEENKKVFYGTREEAIAMGYSPCGRCHP